MVCDLRNILLENSPKMVKMKLLQLVLFCFKDETYIIVHLELRCKIQMNIEYLTFSLLYDNDYHLFYCSGERLVTL